MNNEERLAAARQRFAHSLTGRWTGAEGTFSMVMDEEWEFRADGSGYRRIKGPFGQIRAEVRFEWRSIGEHTIESRVVAAFEDGVARDVDDDERDWLVTRYDFRTFPTDTGTEIAMVERTPGGEALRGFGDGMIPLAFRGPPDS